MPLLYADDDNESRVNCNTMEMKDRNSLAGNVLKVELMAIAQMIQDKRVRYVKAIATVSAYGSTFNWW